MAPNRGRLWVVDRRAYFRPWAVQVLRQTGLEIKEFSSYKAVLPDPGEPTTLPDLVVLACTKVSEDERVLLRRLVIHELRILFLVDILPVEELRALFLAGAVDARQCPDAPDKLLALVEENVKASQKARERPRVWMKAAM